MSDTPAEEIARKLITPGMERAVYTLEERIVMAIQRDRERKDERIRELEQERDNLKHRVSRARFDLPGTYFHCMSGHYYAGTRGDEECPVCERLQKLEQANKELLEALQQIADNLWTVAKDSFDTNEGHPERDFRESDPEGFACYKDARAALSKHGGTK